jgi:glycine/D-amino acid oxidase-like deaminating enzyme
VARVRAGVRRRLLVDCGCLNLVKGTVTPDLASTYAVESYAVLEQLQLRREAFDGATLRERFPQFDADGGWLDVDAGFADLAAVTQSLCDGLAARGVRVVENNEPLAITQADGTWIVATSGGPVESDALVVTAGLGTNDVLGLVPGCTVRFPLRADRPAQSRYFIPRPDQGRCSRRRRCRCSRTWTSGSTGTQCTRGRRPG